MKNKFISNLILLLSLNLPIKALWILYVDRKVYNTLGQDVYGEYASILSFSFMFHILLDLGISNYNNRAIAQNPRLLNIHYPNIILIKAILTGLYLSVVFISANLLQFGPQSILLLKLLAINQVLNVFIYYNKTNLSGLHLFRIDSIFTVLDRVIAGLLCVLFFADLLPINFDIEWYIIFQMIGYLCSAIISTAIILSKVYWPEFRLDLKLVLDIVKKSLPFTLLGILMVMYSKVDIVMIKILLGDKGNQTAGIYAGAYKLLDAGVMICFLFASLLLPIFSRMIAQNENIKGLITFTVKSLIIPISIFVIIASSMSEFIMNQMYKSAEGEMYITFSILIYCFIPLACQYTFGTLLTAGNHLKVLNITSAIGLLLNIILNALLIPIYGAKGAALATISTQMATNGIQLIIAYRKYNLKINNHYWFKSLILLVLLITMAVVQPYWSVSGFIKLPLLLTSGLAAAYLLKLFDIESVLSIVALKKENK